MNLATENKQVLNLVQAMIGFVTPNFRRVTLDVRANGALTLRFLLAHDDPRDREEIDDIEFEFEALQDSIVEVDVDILIDRRPIHEIELPGRLVYGRKE
jgi:hypothetical protein